MVANQAIQTDDESVVVEAPNLTSLVVRSVACGVTIDGYQQNMVEVAANAVSVQFDLTVLGTGNPDNNNITGMFSTGARNYALTIIKVGGMNWYAVVSSAWFPAAGQHGYINVSKNCMVPPGASATDTLTFV